MADPDECFVAFNVTLQGLDMVQQNATFRCFVNCMFRCPDIETETKRQDYFADGEERVKDGGYEVRSSTPSGYDSPRRYITGFTLSNESNVLPFNPERCFPPARISAYECKSVAFYYYPVEENKGKKCAGLVKMTCEIEATLSEAFYMEDYPFDRQMVELGVTMRRGWKALKRCPEWVDTGYDVDRSPGKAILSESILNYKLYPPWVEESAPDWEIVIYLRIERHYEYEMTKVVLPLFCVVVATNVAFCLSPGDTADRLACVHTMLLACIGFQYVLQSFLPPQPQQSFLDKYVILAMLFIIGVGVQSIIVNFMFIGRIHLPKWMLIDAGSESGGFEWSLIPSRDMGYHVDEHAVNVFDSVTGLVYTALWVIPNAVLYLLRHRMVPNWGIVLARQRAKLRSHAYDCEYPTADDIDTATAKQKKAKAKAAAEVDRSKKTDVLNTLPGTKGGDSDHPEVVALGALWARMDRDGNGLLDRDELRAVLLMLGRKPADIDMDATMKEIDEDGSEEVDQDEFAKWFFAQDPATQGYLNPVTDDPDLD